MIKFKIKKNFESAKSISAERMIKIDIVQIFVSRKIYMATGDAKNQSFNFLYSTSSSEYYIDKRFFMPCISYL